MTDHDRFGRPYVRPGELRDQIQVELDDGFTCREAGDAIINQDARGRFWFACQHGKHFLSMLEPCVGIYHKNPPPPPLPEGVTSVDLNDPEAVHNAIAAALGEDC